MVLVQCEVHISSRTGPDLNISGGPPNPSEVVDTFLLLEIGSIVAMPTIAKPLVLHPCLMLSIDVMPSRTSRTSSSGMSVALPFDDFQRLSICPVSWFAAMEIY